MTDFVGLTVTALDANWNSVNTDDKKPTIRKIIEDVDFNLAVADYCGVYAGDESGQPRFIGYLAYSRDYLLSFTLATSVSHVHLVKMKTEAERIVHSLKTLNGGEDVWSWRRAIDVSDKRRGTYKYVVDTLVRVYAKVI